MKTNEETSVFSCTMAQASFTYMYIIFRLIAGKDIIIFNSLWNILQTDHIFCHRVGLNRYKSCVLSESGGGKLKGKAEETVTQEGATKLAPGFMLLRAAHRTQTVGLLLQIQGHSPLLMRPCLRSKA